MLVVGEEEIRREESKRGRTCSSHSVRHSKSSPFFPMLIVEQLVLEKAKNGES